MSHVDRHFAIAAAVALGACSGQSAADESANQTPPSETRAAAKQVAEPLQGEVPGPDLGAALTLGPDCQLGEPLASIFRQMTTIDPRTYESSAGRPIRVSGFADPIPPTFHRTVIGTDHGEEREVVADLPLSGLWHGLRVARLRSNYFEESDVASQEVHFLESPERVREVFNRIGFRLPDIGHARALNPEDLVQTSIGVDPIAGGASLACKTG
jgi:hypothetical protein